MAHRMEGAPSPARIERGFWSDTWSTDLELCRKNDERRPSFKPSMHHVEKAMFCSLVLLSWWMMKSKSWCSGPCNNVKGCQDFRKAGIAEVTSRLFCTNQRFEGFGDSGITDR